MLSTLFATSCLGESALPDLSRHLWKQRVLVVETPSVDSAEYRDQAAALMAEWPALLERDLHIVTRRGAGVFRVRLIGKDGGVKLDAVKPVSSADLFALIDSMPMRRAEASGTN